MATDIDISGQPSALQQGKTFVKANSKYYHLKGFQLLASLSTSFMEVLLVGSLLLFGAVFGAVAGAIALGSALDNPALGYVLVALLFLVLAGTAIAFRKRIFKPVIRKLSKTYFS